ncbi:DUF2254 domain-containing protein [Mycobacterium sp. ITM-2016-00317]|uniref:DUF2254 domain-containing protein n=1 Tax=Mycobacterium sp. ITM-2016-00317 TaxID=2099694 RepID=UPI00287F54BE|nr:DUF2254 domain-containing protein [Mycobacterium sp. ITM-2016-00317]WNG88068.1 DUF2254 domain-containing protein [Mycobacterium sp. ITM-2016-00317]
MLGRSRTVPALRIASGRYRFRESLFALPTVVVIGGAVLAEATAFVDRVTVGGLAIPLTVRMNSNAATWLLSTVAGATITTAGVVFSLTVVSLQLASSQFSPRVMRSFIRDRVSQLVIGLLVATFVFCVLALRHVSADPAANAPPLQMTFAIVLTLTTVLLIIGYLNRLAHGLQVGEVVRAISKEADHVLEATTREARAEEPALEEAGEPSDDRLVVRAGTSGWVTQAPSKYILAAVPPSTVVRLETRTGAYIHRGEVLMSAWPMPEDPERTRARLLATVEVADIRTMQYDVDFGIRQLVDIALRALSAAINDPTTATEVVLRLGSLLRDILVSELPLVSVRGPHGRTLLRPWILSHDEYIEHAFDPIRQAAVTQIHVVTALLRVLQMLIDHVVGAGRTEHVPALRAQITLLMDAVAARTDIHADDLARLRAIAEDTDPAEHDLR